MEPTAETKKTQTKGLLIIAVLVLLAIIVFLLFGRSQKEDDSGRIQYAADAVVVLDEDSLAAALDKAAENADSGNVALWYQNNAYSEDGTKFTCFIGNSGANLYDDFLTIFADAELTDELYLSGLVPPGSGFEEITLEHPLDSGDHTVYAVVTLVEDDENGEQTIRGQVIHTIQFHVSV